MRLLWTPAELLSLTQVRASAGVLLVLGRSLSLAHQPAGTREGVSVLPPHRPREGSAHTPVVLTVDVSLSSVDSASFLLSRGKETSVEFDRKRVSQERGGRLMEAWSSGRVSKNCFVLSDGYCRTEKYLMALACGVPCVSYEWIGECVREQGVVSYKPYLLPAGFSTERNSVLKWSPRTQGSILLNITVHVAGDEDFKSRWMLVARKAGANICSKMPKSDSRSDSEVVIVCPLGYPTAAQLQGCHGGLPKVVSPEWLVQCLIEGRKLENYQLYSHML